METYSGKEKRPFGPKKVFNILDSFHLTVHQRSLILKDIYLLYKRNPNPKAKAWRKILLSRFDRTYPTEFELIRRSNKKTIQRFCQV